jgi:hypothetical protein
MRPTTISTRFRARSEALVLQLESGLPRMMFLWTIAVSFACGLRVAFAATPVAGDVRSLLSLAPYALVVGAPVASLMLALRWFPAGRVHAQPVTRLARFGRWRPIGADEARALPLYGATGLMASLLVGMLLNIPVRTLEFLAAIPAMGDSAPAWFGTLFALMLLDVVLLSSLYAVAFVAALRHIPLFPRLLAAIWGMDLLMQIVISRAMAAVPDLPATVGAALHGLLEGNMKKVLISVALWLPYLLLSRRVNLTYRHRVTG